MPLNIISSDITEIKCDAIVNPTNIRLIPGGGLDKTIQDIAGAGLLIDRIAIGKLGVGHAAMTDAYNMPCKKIIHVASPVYIDGYRGEDILLAHCYAESLNLLSENKLNSIAFPLIASGTNGFPDKTAFSIAKSAILNYLDARPDTVVYLVVYNKGDIAIDEMLKLDIARYVDKNLLPKNGAKKSPQNKTVARKLSVSLDVDISFTDKLIELLNEKKVSNAECYKRANLDRKLFSKILNGNVPKKRTILALCISLKLTLTETQRLLNTAGYAVSHSIKLDIIVEYFIINEKYDIYELNEVLYENGLPTLGSN